MKLFILALTIGVALGNDWATLRDRCDRNDDKSLDSTEFDCLFMQFDTNHDGHVNELEFETGWRHDGIDYDTRIPVFFMETDITGDFMIAPDDMHYLKTLWDSNGDGKVSENELKENWQSFYYDRFHDSD